LVIYGLALSFVPHEHKTSFIEIDARCILIVWKLCVDYFFDDFFMFFISLSYNINDPSSFPWYFVVFFLFVHGRNISMESSYMKGNSDASYSITCGGISW
jgi:hypothetical protein